jgi:hypothetical protein
MERFMIGGWGRVIGSGFVDIEDSIMIGRGLITCYGCWELIG